MESSASTGRAADSRPDAAAAWTRRFARADLPVLRSTVRRLAALAEDERASPRDVAEVVRGDPLASARLFARLSARRPASDAVTIEALVLMMGMDRVRRLFTEAPTVEAALAAHPAALVGLLRVAARARRGADFARTIAAWRHDVAVEEIGLAALLHDIAEMLLWCLAPGDAQRLSELRTRLPTARSRDLQRRLLGADLHEVQLALAREWRLPALLIALMDDDHAASPRVRNVVHAVNVARHAANGWDDPALPDDYAAIAALIHTDAAFAERVVKGEGAPGSGGSMPDRTRAGR